MSPLSPFILLICLLTLSNHPFISARKSGGRVPRVNANKTKTVVNVGKLVEAFTMASDNMFGLVGNMEDAKEPNATKKGVIEYLKKVLKNFIKDIKENATTQETTDELWKVLSITLVELRKHKTKPAIID